MTARIRATAAPYTPHYFPALFPHTFPQITDHRSPRTTRVSAVASQNQHP